MRGIKIVKVYNVRVKLIDWKNEVLIVFNLKAIDISIFLQELFF